MFNAPDFPTQISPNRRFLCRADGSPFFYLGDTAWMLFHRLDREESDFYLQHRARQGFTVIQAVILAELDGLSVPNRYGELPLHDLDPTRPNEAYFQHVDWVIRRAGELGLCLGLLPTWGDKWNQAWGAGPEIFTPQNAAIYGEWLGRRYRDAPLIWILGGDRPVENAIHRAIIENMALGLRRGDGRRHLVTFHPPGARSSSEWFHDAPWLDFNMAQTGHSRARDSSRFIAADYALSPSKPCLDGEPDYEEIPDDLQEGNDLLNAADARAALYRALFAGACGHTYGANSIWQMWESGREPLFGAKTSWRDALHLPGAAQMQHARTLLESRPFFSRIPDQSLILQSRSDDGTLPQATREENGSYALIYFVSKTPAVVDLTKLAGSSFHVFWFDPRNGRFEFAGEIANRKSREFVPPTADDWVLVLDDAAQNFALPRRYV